MSTYEIIAIGYGAFQMLCNAYLAHQNNDIKLTMLEIKLWAAQNFEPREKKLVDGGLTGM